MRPIIPRLRLLPLKTLKNPRYQSTLSTLNPRLLTDLKSRIGKCILFGLSPAQTHEAGSILQEVNSDWREIVAGSEGYLTGREWTGLKGREVVWGEMVSIRRVLERVWR